METRARKKHCFIWGMYAPWLDIAYIYFNISHFIITIIIIIIIIIITVKHLNSSNFQKNVFSQANKLLHNGLRWLTLHFVNLHNIESQRHSSIK